MLHTHDDFLKAIAANPADRTLRLVFADWLDEHAQPEQAELIRVEEEMRALPVFSDRFWELKPRRNELRTLAGTDWCGHMRYGTECEPVFRHGIPDGWRERWRLIREFTERWHRIPMPDVGGRQKEIAEVKTRFGMKLPPSVHEWIAFAHDTRYAERVPAALRALNGFGVVPGYAALSVWSPSGSDFDARWGIQYADLVLTDPPVYRFDERYNVNQELDLIQSKQPEMNELTSYAFVCLPSLQGAGGGFRTEVERPVELLRELDMTFLPPTQLNHNSVYEAENLIVWIRPSETPESVSLVVQVAKQFEREQIPTFLWDYACTSHSRQGIFAPQ